MTARATRKRTSAAGRRGKAPLAAPPKMRAPRADDGAEIVRMLVLSTSHVPRRFIEADGDLPTGTHPTDYGALMWVPDEHQERDDGYAALGANMAPEVLAVRRFARARGCVYILFDADGPTMRGLADYSDTYQ